MISTQRKTLGLALSIILTLRLPQVLDKLDQILRYLSSKGIFFSSYTDSFSDCKMLVAFVLDSACTSIILGANDELTEEESRYSLITLSCF